MRTDSVPVRTGLHHPFSPQDKIMRWRLWSVHHTRGHPQRGANGRQNTDNRLDNEFPGFFLGHERLVISV